MKRSTKFWIIVATVFLIAFNIWWYYYEKKWAWTKFGDDSPHTILVGLYAVMFDIIYVGLVLQILIPKFNNWLDNK